MMEFQGKSTLVFCETHSQEAIIDSMHIFNFSANINPI